MINLVLNVLSLGAKPLYERQIKFHNIITEFRDKLSKLEEVSLTEAEISHFYKELETFDFSFVFFADYYRKYITDLNRFVPQKKSETLDLTFLMIAIAEDKWKPTKPFSILSYHIRYKYNLAFKYFLSRQNRENHKKLKASEVKIDSSKKWTRVPLGK